MSDFDSLFNNLHKEMDYITLKNRLNGIACNTCGKLECDGFHAIAYPCEVCGNMHGVKQVCPRLERLER